MITYFETSKPMFGFWVLSFQVYGFFGGFIKMIEFWVQFGSVWANAGIRIHVTWGPKMVEALF